MFTFFNKKFLRRRPAVELGIDVLTQSNFEFLSGQRIGLLSHPAGVNGQGEHILHVLRRQKNRVNLVALFGPEHSFTGKDMAEERVMDRIDHATGLPVYSLYGQRSKPMPEILQGIDVMVIDLQEIGVRSYTYISCMKQVIEACFENGIDVMVLDRPNPLGGLKTDGPLMDEAWRNYLGAFPMPYVHGLTIGEIARMAVHNPGWLDLDEATCRRGNLRVVAMQGWTRSMRWKDTGLSWTPTSPAIRDTHAAEGYAMSGLGCIIGGFRHGYGTPHPFRLLGHVTHPRDKIESELRKRSTPGLSFKRKSHKDYKGLYLEISDWEAWRPTELSFHMMQMACAWSDDNPFTGATEERATLFNRHVGSTEWWEAIRRDGADVDVNAFIEAWGAQARIFRECSRRWWLYPE